MCFEPVIRKMRTRRSRLLAFSDAVLFLVGILVGGAAIGSLIHYERYAADRRSCLQNIRMLSAALLMYAQDHDGALPAAERLVDGESCLIDERRKADQNPEYRFITGTLWNQAIASFLPSRPGLQCPNDPTGLYKLSPPLSYSPLTGPSALVNASTCEQLNGVMGKNWGANLSSVSHMEGTALLYEMISPQTKDYQLPAGTIKDHPWHEFSSSSWCGVLTGTAVYPRREIVFNYDEENHFQGPHLGRMSIALVDGHAISIPLEVAAGGGTSNCAQATQRSVFDRRHPLGGIVE